MSENLPNQDSPETELEEEEIENPDELHEGGKSFLFYIVRQLTKGQDLSKVLIPTFFLEPRSLLEKYCDLWTHPQLILGVAHQDDPLERMVMVLKWYLSGWHIRPKGCKKPYNPLLGEVFFAHWDHADGSRSTFVAEQVSHHPPVSAVFIENRKHHIAVNAHVDTKSGFYGNYAVSIPVGQCDIYLTNRDNEKYTFTFPRIYACGLFIGKLRMEIGDKCVIKCEQTGYEAHIEFLTKPFFRGRYNEVKGTIIRTGDEQILRKFHGVWDDKIYISNPQMSGEEVFFDPSSEPREKKIVRPKSEQGSWESRNVWKDLTIALKKQNDHDEGTNHKTILEEAQRTRRKQRNEDHIDYNTFMFDPNEDKTSWTFKQLNERLKPYDPKEDERKDKEDIFAYAHYKPPTITPYSNDTDDVAVRKLQDQQQKHQIDEQASESNPQSESSGGSEQKESNHV